MKYRAVIFDLDGTILDTLEDLRASLNDALRRSGYPERSLDEVRRFIGNGIGKLIARGVPEGTPPEAVERVHRDFTAHYTLHCADRTRPYDGIPELLAALRRGGCRTAVVSNKGDYAVQELIGGYFPGLFDAAVGERPGVRRKPAPDSVNEVLRLFGLRPDEAVYVGDSDVDAETARAAGTACVNVDWGFRSREFLAAHGAETIVSSPDELLALVR